MRLPKMVRLLMLTGAAAVAGCASFGEEFDMAAADQLKPGVSTIADAKAVLGEPQSVARSAGNTIYVWMYSHANGLTGISGAQSVSMAFGPDGKLLDNTMKSNVAGKQH